MKEIYSKSIAGEFQRAPIGNEKQIVVTSNNGRVTNVQLINSYGEVIQDLDKSAAQDDKVYVVQEATATIYPDSGYDAMQKVSLTVPLEERILNTEGEFFPTSNYIGFNKIIIAPLIPEMLDVAVYRNGKLTYLKVNEVTNTDTLIGLVSGIDTVNRTITLCSLKNMSPESTFGVEPILSGDTYLEDSYSYGLRYDSSSTLTSVGANSSIDGDTNTSLVINSLNSLDSTKEAALVCTLYKCGGLHWYLPASQELVMLSRMKNGLNNSSLSMINQATSSNNNYDKANNILLQLRAFDYKIALLSGSTNLTEGEYISSTEMGANYIQGVALSQISTVNVFTSLHKSGSSGLVRAFTQIHY